MEREIVVQELQRVAASLSTKFLSRTALPSTEPSASRRVKATFGSWNEGIAAAGLVPLPAGGLPKAEQRRKERLARGSSPTGNIEVSDDELLDDLLRLGRELRRRPSGDQVLAKGKFSRNLYRKRWGSVSRAYDAALARSQRA